jgi:hypothetical protein
MSRKQVWIAVLMLILVNFQGDASAQDSKADAIEGARSVLQRFLDLNKDHLLLSPEAKALLTGEALERWKSPHWGKLTESPDHVELLRKGRAVGRVQWFGANEQVTDFYFYLSFDGAWKLEAVRYLALTGVIEMAYLELKAIKSPTQEQIYQLKNLELTLASDGKLRKWFTENQAALSGIVELLASSEECSTGYYAKSKCTAEVQSAMRAAYIGGIEKHKDGDVFLTIGGMTDNEVGFLYSPRNSPPPIDPGEFIWVERVSEHWFLYRTT